MSQVTIFLREGQVFALTVDKPEKPTVCVNKWNSECGDDSNCICRSEMRAYESALASARESAVRIVNDLRADNIWVEIMEEGKMYTLPSEYKMRVELVRERIGITTIQKVATIYREEPKEETQEQLWKEFWNEYQQGEDFKAKWTIARK